MLAKTKLNSTEDLISKALIDFNISHEQFALVKNKKSIMIWKKKPKILIISKYGS